MDNIISSFKNSVSKLNDIKQILSMIGTCFVIQRGNYSICFHIEDNEYKLLFDILKQVEINQIKIVEQQFKKIKEENNG